MHFTEYILGKQSGEWWDTIYLVASATRGLDAICDTGAWGLRAVAARVKDALTGRFRSIMFDELADDDEAMKLTHSGVEQIANDIETLIAALPGARQSVNHWLEHAIRAVETTADHPIWDGHASTLAHALRKLRAD